MTGIKHKGTKRSAPFGKNGKPFKKAATWKHKKKVAAPVPPPTRKEKRQQKRERRMQQPQGELVELLKEKWSKAQRTNCDADVRAQLVVDMLSMMAGKIAMIAQKHDASRIIQCCAQYGTEPQLESLVNELQPVIIELSKSAYGHHLIKKLFTYCKSKEDSSKSKKYTGRARQALLKAFEGNLVKLSSHTIASQVIEFMFDSVFTDGEARMHMQEFYSPAFKYFKEPSKKGEENPTNSFAALLESADELKKDSMLKHLGAVLKKLSEKGMLRHSFVHDLLYSYLCATDASGIDGMIDYVKDVAPALCSTRNGLLSALQCISSADAKSRKKIVKSFKDDIWRANGQGLSHHVYAHMAVVHLLYVVDDQLLNSLYTAPVNETIESSAQSDGLDRLFDVATHSYAKKLLMIILNASSKRIFSPEELIVLKKGLQTKGVNGQLTSKKSSEQRNKELLNSIRKPLTNLCLSRTFDLFRDEEGVDVLVAAAVALNDPKIFDRISEAAVKEFKVNEKENVFSCGIRDAAGHFAIQELLQKSPSFALFLFNRMNESKGGISTWCTFKENRPLFVLTAILKYGSLEVSVKLKKHLEKQRKSLSDIASTIPGAKALLALL